MGEWRFVLLGQATQKHTFGLGHVRTCSPRGTVCTDSKREHAHRAAVVGPQVTAWHKALVALMKQLNMGLADHRKAMETRKAMEGSMMQRLGGRVASTLSNAKSTMQAFGFSGYVWWGVFCA